MADPFRETVADAVRRGGVRLAAAGVENPRLEARLLLAHAAACQVTDLLRESGALIGSRAFDALLERRQRHEPLAYIVGHREFWSLDFLVSPATLIPRPDTETVVEAALASSPDPHRVLDLGTGTGCLLLSVLHERPRAFGVGIDLAPEAATLAAANAKRLGMADRAAFLCADWSSAVVGQFDLVLSNPPYIAAAMVPCLMRDVADWEPARALDGGPDGLESYRCILETLPGLLSPGGTAVLELGFGQAEPVMSLAARHGMRATVSADLAGVERAILLRYPAA